MDAQLLRIGDIASAKNEFHGTNGTVKKNGKVVSIDHANCYCLLYWDDTGEFLPCSFSQLLPPF